MHACTAWQPLLQLHVLVSHMAACRASQEARAWLHLRTEHPCLMPSMPRAKSCCNLCMRRCPTARVRA